MTNQQGAKQEQQGFEAIGPNPDYRPPMPRWHHVEVRATEGHEYRLEYDDGGMLEISVYEPGETLPDETHTPDRGLLRIFNVDAERDQPVHELRASLDASQARVRELEAALGEIRAVCDGSYPPSSVKWIADRCDGLLQPAAAEAAGEGRVI